MNTRISSTYFNRNVLAAPLAVFRIIFGLMMLGSVIRFWAKGWIEELYILPSFHFSYHGFEWIKPIGNYTYGIFVICGIAALFVALGWFYRIASILLFLSFTYIELMDKTTYLNHYYFVSIICFLLILLPANVYFSVDSKRDPSKSFTYVPGFTLDVLRIMMAILYIYAGIAKINSDWLLHAQPLRTWIPAKNDIPVIGTLFNKVWIAYLFSWFGCIYDLTIPFWLSWRKTRPVAFLMVVIFHGLTALLFPIGMFPYIMIVSSLIFFPADFHKKLISKLQVITYQALTPVNHLQSHGTGTTSFFQSRKPAPLPQLTFAFGKKSGYWLKWFLVVFILLQLVIPFRYCLYPGELFWTEEGFRFSWRVMLMEKNGNAIFKVKEPSTGRIRQIDNGEWLTRLQEKQMSFQPDMILEFSHRLVDKFREKGWKEPQVFVEDYVTLNGRPSQLFIDTTVNLAAERESFKHKNWILPFNDEIKGF